MYKIPGSGYKDNVSSNTPIRMCAKAEGMEYRRRAPERMQIHDQAEETGLEPSLEGRLQRLEEGGHLDRGDRRQHMVG